MDEAVNLVNLFCRSAMPVVQVRDREGELTTVSAGTTTPKFPNIVVSILVGGSSYSAAELFAGCMQDLDRATIIGQQTGGKGLVMNQIDLSNGDGLLLATGRYYLPSGRYIQVPYRDGIQNEGRPELEHVEVNYLHTCERPERCEAAVYFTRSERMVYSGMGIIPDVFVPDHTNVCASAGLSPATLWKLWLDLVDHFQPQLVRSQSYDAFCELVPIAMIADYLRPRIVEFRHGGSVGAQELELLAAKLSAYTQICAFGRYTHTARTLAFDRSVRVAMQLEAPVATTRLAEVQAAVTLHKHAGK